MTKVKLTRLEKWAVLLGVDPDQQCPGLLEVILDVHMKLNRSMDGIPTKQQVQALRWRYKNWNYGRKGISCFDEAVHRLLVATINEIDQQRAWLQKHWK